MKITRLTDLDVTNQRVVIRVDFNVPLNPDGSIANAYRLEAAMPTLQHLLKHNAKVLILSHLGKPKEGEFDPKFSLKPVADWLTQRLGFEVPLVKNWLEPMDIAPGKAALAENVRFNVGEGANDEALSRKIAALSDIYVMDAFATAHRAQASTCGAIKFAPKACGGLLLMAEVDALERILENPKPPVVAIAAGSKISTKLALLKNLIGKVQTLLVGGGIANTFLAASGVKIGKSLHEVELLATAKEILELANSKNTSIPLPSDVVVAKEANDTAAVSSKNVSEVLDDEMILDIGPNTTAQWSKLLQEAGTIVWNGPVGMFELNHFREGTKALAAAIANSKAFSVLGGGDTVAAIERCGFKNEQFGYVSTAGGAFMEFLQGEKLPALEALQARAVLR